MRTRETLLLLAAATLVGTTRPHAQDPQSLGDAARQARLQKQQRETKAKDASTPSSTAQPTQPPKKVVTNDDIPEHVGSTLTFPSRTGSPSSDYTPQGYGGSRKAPAEQWKTMIQAQKIALVSLQRQIDRLNDSLQHPETCIADCALRNERQGEKAAQLESMKAQLEGRQKMLEELQDAARKQGFGSAVYDP